MVPNIKLSNRAKRRPLLSLAAVLFVWFCNASSPAVEITSVVDFQIVAQLTGTDTMNQTGVVGVGGTDLGHMVNHNGKTYFLFGDTCTGELPADGGFWRSSAMSYTTDTNPADGIHFDGWITNSSGQAREVIYSGRTSPITEIPTGAISVGNRIYAWYMAVDSWNPWTASYGGLAHWQEGDSMFTVVDSFAFPGNGNFGMVAASARTDPAGAGDDHVYVWGTPAGRLGGVKLARVLPGQITNHDAYQYYGGMAGNQPTWITDEFAAPYVVAPMVGEMSVMYNEAAQAWTMLYLSAERYAIEMRYAQTPWGPWSSPLTVAHGSEYTQLYGSYMNPLYVENDGETIYFTMSQWDPYDVFLVKARLVYPGATLTSATTGYWSNSVTWGSGGFTPTQNTRAVVGNHIVTVTTNANAYTLTMNGANGRLTIGPNNTLTVGDHVAVHAGLVYVQGALNAKSFEIDGGAIRLDTSGSLTAADVKVLGGILDTGTRAITVNHALTRNKMDYTIDGAAFAVQGRDVLTEAHITLGGGTLTVASNTTAPGGPADPVGYWAFDEVAGGQTPNAGTAGPAHNGVLIGNARLAGPGDEGAAGDLGKIGGALHFDGAGDFVRAGDLDTGGTFSVAFWCRWDGGAAPTGWPRIVDKKPPGQWDTPNGWAVNLAQDADRQIQVLAGNGSVLFANNVVDSWAAGGWHHVTVVFDDGTASVFADGDPNPKANGTVTPFGQNDFELKFGYGDNFYWDGLLDEMYLFDRALTGTEAAWLHQAGVAGAYPIVPIQDPTTHYTVIADTTLHLDTNLPATLGNVTLQSGVRLNVTGAPSVGFRNVSGGNGSSLSGVVSVLDTLTPGDGVGAMNVVGMLTMGVGSVYEWELGSESADRVGVAGALALYAGGWTLKPIDSGATSAEGDLVLFTYGSLVGNSLGSYTIDTSAVGDWVFADGGPWLFNDTLNRRILLRGVESLRPRIPGDANDDGRVDDQDAKTLAAHWGQSGTWTQGDFDGNGVIGPTDASILAANWGFVADQESQSSGETTAVPEPGTLAMLLAAALMMLVRRR